jgi:hypothetical protein
MIAEYKGFDRSGLFQRCVASLMLGGAAALFAGCSAAPQQVASAPVAEPAPTEPVTDLSSARAASDVSLRSDAPLIYTVKNGDTLWGIAGRFLENPWEWPELWYENAQVKNPHLIYPGQQLKLVWVNGKPRLVNGDDYGYGDRLSPQIRELPLDGALPAIPVDAIRNFINGPRLVGENELSRAPYIVEFTEPHLANGAIANLFAKGIPDKGDTVWSIVHPGSRYVDPDSGEVLGYEAIPVARAEVRNFGPITELQMTESYREVLRGDRLLPVEKDKYDANFYPHRPKSAVTGRIISVYDGVVEIPQYQIVALNRGERDGLDVGSVLTILKAGKKVSDPHGAGQVQLPDQSGGTMMVFKTTKRVSFALVLSVTRDVHVLDKFTPPLAGTSMR